MKSYEQKIIDDMALEINKAVTASMMDASIYGYGFIRIDEFGRVEHITYQEALKHAEYIDKNCYKI